MDGGRSRRTTPLSSFPRTKNSSLRGNIASQTLKDGSDLQRGSRGMLPRESMARSFPHSKSSHTEVQREIQSLCTPHISGKSTADTQRQKQMSGSPAPKTDTSDHQGYGVEKNSMNCDRDSQRGGSKPKDYHKNGNAEKLIKPGATGNLRTIASSRRHDVASVVPITSRTRNDANNIFSGDNDRKSVLRSLRNTDLEGKSSLQEANLPGADTSHGAKYDLPRRSRAKPSNAVGSDGDGRNERDGSITARLAKSPGGLSVGVRVISQSPLLDTSEMPMFGSKHGDTSDSGLPSTSLSMRRKMSDLRSSQMESKNILPDKVMASRPLMKALSKSSSRNGGVNLRTMQLSAQQDTSEMPMFRSKHRGTGDSGLPSTSLSMHRKTSGLRSSRMKNKTFKSSVPDKNSRGAFEAGVDADTRSGKVLLDARDRLSRVHHVESSDGELSQRATRSEPSTNRNVGKQLDGSNKVGDATLSTNHGSGHSLRRGNTGNPPLLASVLHKRHAPSDTLTHSNSTSSKLHTDTSQHHFPLRRSAVAPVTLRSHTGADQISPESHILSRTDGFTQNGSDPRVVLKDCGQMKVQPITSRSRGTYDSSTEEQRATDRLGPLNPDRRSFPEQLHGTERQITKSKAEDYLHSTKEVAVVPLNMADLSVLHTSDKSESDVSLLLLRGTSLKHPAKSAKAKKRVDLDADPARRSSHSAQLHGLASKDRTGISPLVPMGNSSLRHMANERKSEDVPDASSAITRKLKRPSSSSSRSDKRSGRRHRSKKDKKRRSHRRRDKSRRHGSPGKLAPTERDESNREVEGGGVTPVHTRHHAGDTQSTEEHFKDTHGQVDCTPQPMAASTCNVSAGVKDTDSAGGSLGVALPLPANCRSNDAVYWSPNCTPERAESGRTKSDRRHEHRRPRRRMSVTMTPDPVLTPSDVGALMKRIDTGLRTRQRNVMQVADRHMKVMDPALAKAVARRVGMRF